MRAATGVMVGDEEARPDVQHVGGEQEQPMDANVVRQENVVQLQGQRSETWAGDEQADPLNQDESDEEDEVNKDFQDVRVTGRWGTVTRAEKCFVAAVAVAVIIAIVVVAVVVTGSSGGSGDDSPPAAPTNPPTIAPTFSPFTRFEKLETLLALIGNFTSTEQALENLPADEEFYDGLFSDPQQPPAVRAMSWALNEDPLSVGPTNPWLAPRFALAALYYATGGPSWTNSDGWLTGAHTCDWYGIDCDRSRTTMEQLDLQSNNLQSNLPNEIALLIGVRSLWFRRNALTGKLPALAFNDLHVLRDLYLESNQFTGRIPAVLARSVPPLSE